MTDLGAALAEHGLHPKGLEPGDSKMLCPRCSHARKKKTNPCLSLTIDDEGGAVWHCYNCDWSANVPSERNERERTPAKLRPTKKPPAPTNATRTEAMYQWFGARSISRETVDQANIFRTTQWFPQSDKEEPCIAFPYTRGGEVLNHKYRTAGKHFRQDKDAAKSLYNVSGLVGNDMAIFVEGELDVLSVVEGGYPCAVTLPDGAPAKLKNKPDPDDKRFAALANCEEELEPIKKFIIATDADGPGEVLAEELARRLGKELCWRVAWPDGCKDANEVLIRHGPDKVRECIEAAEPYPIRGLYKFSAHAEQIWALYRGDRGQVFSTGWLALDKMMQVRPGDVTVVTGTPNSGKSEFVDALLVNLSERHGWHFCVCSFENEPDEHASKLAEKHLGKPFAEGPTPRMTEGELAKALDWIDAHFTMMRADDTAPDIDWILERAKVSVLRHGSRGLVIDPFNEIAHTRARDMSETDFVSLMLGKVRRFARAHEVHVWFVAHPAKPHPDQRKKPPGLYDIAGSAQWRNKADVGLTVHRDMEDRDKAVQIIVGKVRSKRVGQLGVVEMFYDRATGIYREAL